MPDGSTLYVGGDFITLDGQPRGHLAAFDVATGALKAPRGGNTRSAYGYSSAATEVQVDLVFKMPTGGGAYLTLAGREVGTSGGYRVKVFIASSGAVTLIAVRTSSTGAEAVLTSSSVSGLTYMANQVLRVRVQVTGTWPTSIEAKVWNAASTEPSARAAKTTDSTVALQAPGGVGLIGDLASTALTRRSTSRSTGCGR